MRKKSILGLFMVVMLVACDTGGNRKPLMSGIATTANAVEKTKIQSVSTGENSESEKTYMPADDRIEIPAQMKNTKEQILKRVGYIVSYNKDTRIPNWVAWHLTAAHVSGKNKRSDIDFQEDTDVPAPRATNWDYYRSGYDRGHMCPAGDNKWDATAMQQSFLFTNMCPQAPGLNRGDWNEIEQACRKWAKKFGGVYIVSGPILYREKHKMIGENKVVVPEAFFKVVLCLQGTPKAIGFIYKNTDGNRPKDAYVNSIDQVERITGIDFFPNLPDNIENKVEAEKNLDDWMN